MSDRGVAEREEPQAAGRSAGAMIRAARKAQGLHIAVLAASIKVPPQKLEALEGDRFDQLPDATFTRALAKTVCRVLKIDADPVLERLPPGPTQGLERIASGLNTPFRERSGRREPRESNWGGIAAFWGAAILIVAAAVLLLAPIDWSRARQWLGAAAPASSAAGTNAAGVVESTVAPVVAETTTASAPAVTASGIVTESLPLAPSVPVDVASAPTVTAGVAPAASTVAAAAASPLVITASSADSWVEVLDASGQMLISRTVLSGETVGLDGATPLKVRIGNAHATQLSFRGQPVDLKSATRDNIARLELK